MTAALTLSLFSTYLLLGCGLARRACGRAERRRARIWWERMPP